MSHLPCCIFRCLLALGVSSSGGADTWCRGLHYIWELQHCANILSISAFGSVSDFTTLACPFVLFAQVEVNHASEIDAIFDSISYDKGASVIRMLQSYLGAERFQVWCCFSYEFYHILYLCWWRIASYPPLHIISFIFLINKGQVHWYMLAVS